MENLIKSFVIIFILSSATFWVAGKALPNFMPISNYKRMTKQWFTVLVAAFFAHNIWLFLAFLTCYCYFFLPNSPQSRVVNFLLLFCVLPLSGIEIPGLFGIRYLFKLTYPFTLSLILLTGLYFRANSSPQWLSLKTDRYILVYFFLVSALSFRDDTFTNGLRECLVHFFKIVIPYYVLSRYLNDTKLLNRALFALYIGLIPLALIGVFETVKHWHVYDPMAQALLGWRGLSGYDIRSGGLRATTIFGNPIVLGYVMVIAFSLLVYLQPLTNKPQFIKIAGGAIIACLISTMARGAWVGLICLYFAFLWTGKGGTQKIAGWILVGMTAMPVLALTPLGNKIIALLPFVGTSSADTVDYRSQLIDQSWLVFKRNPWFGATNYLEAPELEVMRQGQGIIDIVNSYVGLVLPNGLVGLALFLAIFLNLIWQCYFVINRIPSSEVDLIRMGRMFFALLISIMVMITTVSSIDYIPYFYWLFTGIVAGYLHVAEKTIKQLRASRLP